MRRLTLVAVAVAVGGDQGDGGGDGQQGCRGRCHRLQEEAEAPANAACTLHFDQPNCVADCGLRFLQRRNVIAN